MDAGQGELGVVPAPVEVGRKIRITALLDGEEGIKASVDDEQVKAGFYPVKEKLKAENDQRMCIKAELGDGVGVKGGAGKDKILLELNWNAKEKTLHIYPDFNELNEDPYFIEFDHPNGQMILYSVAIAPRKTAKNKGLLQRGKLAALNYSLEAFEAPPDRNHFLTLLLFTFETASGFDYDRLHFKYTLNHASSRTSYHGATHTTSTHKDTHHISHTFEVELKVPYEEKEEERGSEAIEIVLEAFSVDLWNRERYHGFAMLKIPTSIPGHFTRQMQFICHVGTYREALERFFIGGHRRKEVEQFKSNILYGQKMQSSGRIEISYSVIVQHNQRMSVKEMSEGDEEGAVDRRRILDVDAVINGFKQCCSLVEL